MYPTKRLGVAASGETLCPGWATPRSFPTLIRSFDLVLSINTIHNHAARTMQTKSEWGSSEYRASHAFVMVDAFRDEQQRQAMLQWVLTAETS